MPLYHITGISGAGKSTILEHLRTQGFEAYDVDVAGPATAKWTHKVTGFVHPKSSVKAAARTPQFLAEHTWNVPVHEITALAASATRKTVFLGGGFDNDTEVRESFANVFALVIDDDTLRHRLSNRTNNDWGKAAHELERSLAWNRNLEETYRHLGYVIIDATKPADAVLSEILRYVHDDPALA